MKNSIFFLCLFIYSISNLFSQTSPIEIETCIPEEPPIFIGEPFPTGCDLYGDLECDFVIDATNVASFVTGGYFNDMVVCIEVDLSTDWTLSFDNCLVKISEGVSININGKYGNLEIKNNSHLFACEGLWNGIVVDNTVSRINTNESVIEDAEIAIYANQGSPRLWINNSSFGSHLVTIFY